jgi:hypothetical protein
MRLADPAMTLFPSETPLRETARPFRAPVARAGVRLRQTQVAARETILAKIDIENITPESRCLQRVVRLFIASHGLQLWPHFFSPSQAPFAHGPALHAFHLVPSPRLLMACMSPLGVSREWRRTPEYPEDLCAIQQVNPSNAASP